MDIRTSDDGQSHKRELFVDGEQVSHLFVIDHQMRVGTTVVSMAGIGGVNKDSPLGRLKVRNSFTCWRCYILLAFDRCPEF